MAGESRPLRQIIVGGIAIGASARRRRAELARRELAGLGRRLDPAASVATAASDVVDSIAGWGVFDTVLLIGFDGPRSASVLAKATLDVDLIPIDAGERLHAAQVACLRDRAARGPWIERARRERVVSRGRAVRAGHDHCLACVPVPGNQGAAGLLIVAVRSSPLRPALALLADELPVLAGAASLAAATLVPALIRHEAEDAERESIAKVVFRRQFRPVYRPVLDLTTGAVVGFEALTRFDDGRPPEAVFAQAERFGLGLTLEDVTISAAVTAAAELPSGAWLSLNVSPAFLHSGRAKRLLLGQTRPIVLELTEHVAIDDYDGLRAAVAGLGANVRLAVDDAGAGIGPGIELGQGFQLGRPAIGCDLAGEDEPTRHAA